MEESFDSCAGKLHIEKASVKLLCLFISTVTNFGTLLYREEKYISFLWVKKGLSIFYEKARFPTY